jgi:alkanesulfonate monooxygenase SsuD/methylene tetrahydromethanopterin reductase-like flavin-dependent oxidoreductase (luciferase family)
LLKEKIEAMKAIWTEDVAEYKGEYIDFGPMLCFPKPVQKPHPPIYIGGNWKNIRRIVDYADGWIPSTSVAPPEAFLPHIAELQRLGEAAGRGPIPVTALHTNSADVEGLDVGTPGEFREEEWDTWEGAGIERSVLIVPPHRDAALRMIERYSRFATR